MRNKSKVIDQPHKLRMNCWTSAWMKYLQLLTTKKNDNDAHR